LINARIWASSVVLLFCNSSIVRHTFSCLNGCFNKAFYLSPRPSKREATSTATSGIQPRRAFSNSQVQSLEFVVVIDDLEQSRKATIVVEATRLVGPESFERRRTVGFQTVTPLWRNRALLEQTIESRKRTLWGCCQSKLPDDDHKLDGPCSSVA
jgi:hypothetical protein